MGNIAAVQNSVVTIDSVYDELKKAGLAEKLEWLNRRLFIQKSQVNFDIGHGCGFILYQDNVIQVCHISECVELFKSFLQRSF